MIETDGGITFSELAHLIRENSKFIIVLLSICLVFSSVYAWGFVHLKYTATASLCSPSQLANVNAYLTASDAQAAVAEKLNLSNLSDYKISSSTVTATNSATVTVVGPNAEKAVSIANCLVDDAIIAANERLSVPAFVLSSASASSVNVSPNRMMYLAIGLLGGLFLAICIVVIKEIMRTSFTSPKELEKIIGMPVLATLSKADNNDQARHSEIHEGALQLANNVAFYFKNDPEASIAVAGVGRNNDQASTATELAVALAKQGKRVVLIDAEMSERPIAAMLPYKDCPSVPLSAYLGSTEVSVRDIVGRSDYDKLDVVYADDRIPNASLVCSSQVFKKLIQELCTAYDFVVINAPVDLVDDTISVASLADAALLVTACGGARRSDVVTLYECLSEASVNVMGTVLTKVKSAHIQALNREMRD